MTNRQYIKISYVVSAVMAYAVLVCHLLPAVYAGLFAHSATLRLAKRLPSSQARPVALGIIASILTGSVSAAVMLLWGYAGTQRGIQTIHTQLAGIVAHINAIIPPDAPQSVLEMKNALSRHLLSSLLSYAGSLEWLHITVRTAIGAAVGGMVALRSFEHGESVTPMFRVLHARMIRLHQAFERFVFAQVKISAVNTLLTAAFLFIILPSLGVSFPLKYLLVVCTFVCGMIPIVGNLISNALIVGAGISVSLSAAMGALGYLVLIHKLEYFFNARIVGAEISADAWEILCAMLFLESVFGLEGIAAAPVLYGWAKAELRAQGEM